MLGSTSSINNYSSIFGIQPGQSLEQLAKTFTTATTSRREQTTDTVTISSPAAMLQQFLNSEMPDGDTADIGDLDLTGLAQLKQQGEMLANMLQLKMKNFESSLMAGMQGAGLPMQDMHIQNGDDGLSLLGDLQNNTSIQNVLGELQGAFGDIARLAEVLNTVQQSGSENAVAGTSSATQYAQQSSLDRTSVKKPETDFILHVLQSGTSFSFE